LGGSGEPSLYRLTTDADNALCAGDYEAATRLYLAALERSGVQAYQRAAILSNLGLAWQALSRFDKATRCFEDAVDADPNLASAQTGLGNTYAHFGRHGEALPHYDRALELDPRSAITHTNRALTLEALGRIEEAWQEAEWRYSVPAASSYYPFRYAKPRWKGEPLDGRTLLVHREQGFGDIIQYLRFLPMLERFGGRVRFECPRPLVPLVPHLAGMEVLPAETQPVAESAFDCWVPLLSLPHTLQFRAADLAATCPYLVSTDAASPMRLSSPRRIGFVWSGSAFDPARNARLADFLPLLDLDATLVSLQKDLDEGERSALRRHGVEDAGARFRDFGDTRDAIAALDAVISVDTAVVHLAGAIAKPTWLALNDRAAPRWTGNRNDTPWYPTMRIHRRLQNRPWKDLVAEVAHDIDRELAIGRPRS
jgi:tetratricopeptide (TPR) repeat protein